MALFLGSNQVNIKLDGVVYCLNLYSTAPVVNRISLLSSDGYVLKDFNGLYLLPRLEVINEAALMSIDNYKLKDINGLYLTVKES